MSPNVIKKRQSLRRLTFRIQAENYQLILFSLYTRYVQIAECRITRLIISCCNFAGRITQRILRRIRGIHKHYKPPSLNQHPEELAKPEPSQIYNIKEMPAEIHMDRNSKHDDSTTSLPIIFIHYNNSDYLKYSLGQARKSNPGSTIYFLGDQSNDC